MAPVPPPAAHSHRPTQKQTNKPFKSKHSSSRTLKDLAKGRTHRPTSTTSKNDRKTTNAMLSAAHNKNNRKNHAKQLLEKKRLQLEELGRLFSRKGEARVSRVVAVVPMTEDVDPLKIVEELLGAVGVDCEGEGATRVGDVVKFHNQSLRFILLPPASLASSLFAILDGTAAADFVLVGISSSVEVDSQGETALRCMTGTGVGANGGVIGIVPTLPTNSTLSTSTRASLLSFLTHFFPTMERLSCSSLASEASTVVRSLCEKVPKGVRWRDARTRLLAEEMEWVEYPKGMEGKEEGMGELRVMGTVRGARLSADRLVTLQGWGDFMVDKITSAPTARPVTKSSTSTMTDLPTLVDLSLPNPDEADDLASTNVPDDADLLLAEQTWPTEEELASAPASLRRQRESEGEMLPPARNGTTPRRVKRVPKGTSEYQAAWIIDEDDEDEEDVDEWEEEEDEAMRIEGRGDEEEEESVMMMGDDDTASVSARPFADLSPEQEAEQLAQYLADKGRERALQSRDDMDFPDEVDTPMHISARERFARYRGLKSFRTSPWDPYEELPKEYARCFMFEDFKRMGRRMEKKARTEGVEAGTRVILHIKEVPRGVYESHNPLHPFIVFGLLKHEHKYSVMNFTVQRNTEYSDPVRSKDPLVLILGPRRFLINPIFSQHTVRGGGKGSNNVHKFERFLRHGIQAQIGTAYLPITFGQTPAVLLKVPSSERETRIELVGTGTLLSSDPTRITAKRVILTGHPFKVHKKTATIRYMFFNELDIAYYKPVQLRTKRGRTGHIRESLGTHGYFKAGFDGPIDQMDQICLMLYKRCFPKWSKIWDGGYVGAPKIREIEENKESRLTEVNEDGDDVEMM